MAAARGLRIQAWTRNPARSLVLVTGLVRLRGYRSLGEAFDVRGLVVLPRRRQVQRRIECGLDEPVAVLQVRSK